MKSPFLENLKKAVDTGEFNSEAAKKINDIDELANKKFSPNSTFDDKLNAVENRLKNSIAKTVTEEEAAELNSEYEKKMEEIKKRDIVNKQLATLVDIEEMVKASIDDMMMFINDLEDKFGAEIEAQDPYFIDLTQQIGKIKSKYNSIINN